MNVLRRFAPQHCLGGGALAIVIALMTWLAKYVFWRNTYALRQDGFVDVAVPEDPYLWVTQVGIWTFAFGITLVILGAIRIAKSS